MVVLIAAGSCLPRRGEPGYVIDRPPAAQADAVPLTVEEAGLLAGGALVEIYGLDADPVPARVNSDEDVLDGQTVWRLALSVDVTVDDDRTTHTWTMWVGTPDDGPPAVLRALPGDR